MGTGCWRLPACQLPCRSLPLTQAERHALPPAPLPSPTCLSPPTPTPAQTLLLSTPCLPPDLLPIHPPGQLIHLAHVSFCPELPRTASCGPSSSSYLNIQVFFLKGLFHSIYFLFIIDVVIHIFILRNGNSFRQYAKHFFLLL